MGLEAYKTIQPPFTLKFREMTKPELKDYFKWFMEMIPQRIEELSKAVRQTPGYEEWQPDNTPDSLNALGQWLSEHVETRQRTPQEISEIEDRLAFPIEVPRIELTNKAFSLAMDVGMYISQVFLVNHPSLKWEQRVSALRSVDYGQPVLIDFGRPFNPVRMMITQAYALADRKWDGRSLRELYDIWEKKVIGE